MKPAQTFLLKLLACLAVLFCGVSSVAAQTPEILKVEPPSWRIGSSLNPVRVFIRGRNLRGALAQVDGALLVDRIGALTGVRVNDGKVKVTLPARSAAVLVPR